MKSLVIALLLLVPNLIFGAGQPGLNLGLEATDPAVGAPLPTVNQTAFEVHVWGGMAIGRLTQEFVNPTETALPVTFRVANKLGLEIQRVEVESNGALELLPIERNARPASKPGAAGRKSARGTRPNSPPALAEVRTESFELAAEQTTTVHVELSWSLPLEGRVFSLKVPSLQPLGGVVATSEPTPVRVTVVVHYGQPLDSVESETHRLLVEFVGDTTIIEPVERDIPADSPFEVRFSTSDPESTTVAGYWIDDEDGRTGVEAVLNPPELPDDGEVRPKQLLFIVDSSGSMGQLDKMDQARRAVISCVSKLSEIDRYNVVEFDQLHRLMSPEPVDPSVFDKTRVAEWLSTVTVGGGTAILSALEATLAQPEDPERHRMIVVITDGHITDEEKALALLTEKLGEARLFVVGTGQGSRRETLLRLAEYGRGAAVFANDASELELAVEELYASISKPLGWDLELDLGSADVEEILPSRIPDLYAGRPVRVIAWVNGDRPSRMTMRMSTVSGDRFYEILLPPRPE